MVSVPPNDDNATRRLRFLLIGRLVVACLLLGGTLYFAYDALRFGAFTPSFLLILIGIVFATTFAFGAWLHKRPDHIRPVTVTTIAVDLALITGLMYVTGGAGSIFSTLYGAEILMAAIVLGTIPAYLTAAAALLSYFFLGTALSSGWLIPPPGQPLAQYTLGPTELSTALFSNMVGISFVALLATNLASRLRQTGGQLAVAEQSAARLARFNDDIVRSIASGLITTDPEGKIVTINPAARDILGDREGTLIGKSLAQVVPALSQTRYGSVARRQDGTGRRIDGTKLPIGYSLGRLLDAEGHQTGHLFTFQDLTEIRELRVKAERAERLAVLGHLATGLAHEIRNPLSSISGSVEMVRGAGDLDDEDNKLLGIVIEEVDRLNQLVTSMLRVGRPTGISPITIDLCEIVNRVAMMASAGAGAAKGVQVIAHAPSQPVMACVDPAAMRQVIWNLVKNAIEASPRGKHVTVAVDQTADVVKLEVSDEGEGIPPEQRHNLFDMFYSGRAYGVGLGLALVKQIVDQHQGVIEVLDRPAGGTVFRVMLQAQSARAVS